MGQLEHTAFKELKEAEKQLKRWGGAKETDKYIEKVKNYNNAQDRERENEKVSREIWGY